MEIPQVVHDLRGEIALSAGSYLHNQGLQRRVACRAARATTVVSRIIEERTLGSVRDLRATDVDIKSWASLPACATIAHSILIRHRNAAPGWHFRNLHPNSPRLLSRIAGSDVLDRGAPHPGMATADADVRQVVVCVNCLRNCGFCPVLTATSRSHADAIHGAALHMLRRNNLDKSVVAFFRIKPITSPGPLTSEAATAIAALACGCGRGRGGHLVRREAGPNKNAIVSGPMTRGTAVILPSAAAISSIQADAGANVVVTSTGGTSPTITGHHAEHAGLATTTDVPALVPTNWLWVGDNPPCAKKRRCSVPVATKGPPPIPPIVPIWMLLQLDAVLGHEDLRRALACKLNDRHLPKPGQSVGLQLNGIHVLQLVKGNVLGIIGANIRHGRIDHLVWIK